MNTILFCNNGSPEKPVMAAAYLNSMHLPDLKAIAAATHLEEDLKQAREVMTEQGISCSDEVLHPDTIDLYRYDLVISFSDGEKQVFPDLPGNPVVVYWHFEDPVAEKGVSAKDLSVACMAHIRRRTDNLVQEGCLHALLHARKNVELLMDSLHEGIIAHDLNRKIFFFNKSAEEITGLSRKDVLGKDCHHVFPGGFCKQKCSFCDPQGVSELPDRPYSLHILSRRGISKHIEMNVVSMNNFLGKPIGVVASFRDVTRENELATRLGEIEQISGVITQDHAMLEILQTTRDLADSNVPVFIQGESGTGKELIAVAIHNEGKRVNKLFVPVNCGALPENLLEAELFGHVKGAFTGAIRDKKGRFELANGGTLFLDEIGDITPSMQVKLLRVLQDGIFQRVGSEETIKVDVRVVSASHKDLQKEIAARRFREDLFYRLCVVPLSLPPLRERRNDIPLLVRHFLKQFLAEEERSELILAPETMDILLAYEWPGNIRELQNVIRYLLVRCREKIVKPHHLPPNLHENVTRSIQLTSPGKRRGKLSVESVRNALASTKGNRLQAARVLGVGRATLYRFLARHPMD